MHPLRRLFFPLVSAVGLALVSGCGGGDGGGCGSPRNVAGSFSGTLADNNCGTGGFSMTLAQNDCSLQGVWSTNFSVPACNALGSLTGSADDATVSLRLSPTTANSCVLNLTGVVDSNQISGNYVPDGSCQINGGGSFSVTRSSPAPTPTP